MKKSFNKKFLYAIIGLILSFVLILFLVLLPVVYHSIKTNKNQIIELLNRDLEKNIYNTIQNVKKVSDSTLNESKTTNQNHLENQAENIISFSYNNLLNTSNNFLDHEKQMILTREKKRISDLTYFLSQNVRVYISDMDFMTLNQSLNEIMNDEELRYIIVYQNLERKYYETYNLFEKDYLKSDSDYLFVIKNSLNENETLLREYVYKDEAIIESVRVIRSGDRVLGILNIGFSIQSIYDQIIKNSRSITQSVEHSFSEFQKSSLREMELSVKKSNEQLAGKLNLQQSLLEQQFKETQNLLVKNIERHETEQAQRLTLRIIFFITMLGILFLIIGTFVAIKMAKIFSKPIRKFVEHTKTISAGDLTSRLNLQTGDEFEILSNSFNEMCREIKFSRDKLDEWNKSLERQVYEKTNSIRSLLDNAGQGFFSFNKSLLIHKEYSIECINIFNQKLENKNFVDIIYSDNSEQNLFIKNVLNKIFIEKDENKLEIYLSLLPVEMSITDKTIKFEYKLVKQNSKNDLNLNMMVILTDITVERLLEAKMATEQNKLKMIVKVIINYSDFTETVNDYIEYYNFEIYTIINSNENINDRLSEIFRKTHTYKGVLAQFGLIYSVNELQKFESLLSDYIKENNPKKLINDLINIYNNYKPDLLNAIENDMKILKETLGDDFFKNEQVITVDKLKIIEIENKIINHLSPAECRTILPHIRKLRYKEISSFMKLYSDYLNRLSEQLKKPLHPFTIESDDILIDPDIYEDFLKSLIHIVRNALYHGIETQEERLKNNKDEFGKIKCSIKHENNIIKLSFSDDGRGIDIKKIKEILIKNNRFNDKMTDEDILNSIFDDGISTEKNINDISGRGVGLSAVKSEVDKLNGRIEVQSKKNMGTILNFYIPLVNTEEIPFLKCSHILNPIIETANEFFKKEIHVEILRNKLIEFSDNKIKLKKMAAIINIKGVIQGTIILSMDENITRKFAEKMAQGKLNSEEDKLFMEAACLETLNILIGKSIKNFTKLDNLIKIETPNSVFAENIVLTYMDSNVQANKLETEDGNIILAAALNQT